MVCQFSRRGRICGGRRTFCTRYRRTRRRGRGERGRPKPEFHRKRHRQFTPSLLCSPTLTVMRGAFVVQLGPETRPTEGQFEGWVEEVDSGTELRFRSSDELLKFLGARFDLIMASANKDRAGNKSEQVPPRKKSARKKSGTP